jgi:hypothetical protein
MSTPSLFLAAVRRNRSRQGCGGHRTKDSLHLADAIVGRAVPLAGASITNVWGLCCAWVAIDRTARRVVDLRACPNLRASARDAGQEGPGATAAIIREQSALGHEKQAE